MTAIALVSGFDSQIMATKLLESLPELKCIHFASFSNSKDEVAGSLVPLEIVNLAMPQNDPKAPDLTGRDLLMCSYVAMNFGATDIFIGALPEDLRGFHDLSVDYTHKLSRILSETFGRQIMVRYPIVEWGVSKADLAIYAARAGIDTARLVSCFQSSSGVPCGSCHKCYARWVAESAAGEPSFQVDEATIERFYRPGGSGPAAAAVARYRKAKAATEKTPPKITPMTSKSRGRKPAAA